MRVLYVIDSLAPGGAETSLAEMAPGLVSNGVDLHVLPLGRKLDLAQRLTDAGAVIHRRHTRGGRVGSVRAVMQTARVLKPDLIHTTLFESDIAGRTAAKLLGVPACTSIVNDSYSASHRREVGSMKFRAVLALDRQTARFATRFHSISAAVAETVAPRLGLHADEIVVIPRGRDPRKFPFRPPGLRDQTRASLGLDPGAHVVLALGRLEPQKGLHHLINALPLLRREHPDLVVLIAGREGRSSQDLRAAAARSQGDIRFLGHRTDVAALLAAADAFCFPSEREGFGGVLIEALAVGCPVVASSIPTSREVLGPADESTSLLVPVGDLGALALALGTVLTEASHSEAMARRGRERFERYFTIDRVVDQFVAFYKSCLD